MNVCWYNLLLLKKLIFILIETNSLFLNSRFIPFNAIKGKVSKNMLLLITSVLFAFPHVITMFSSVGFMGDLLSLPKYLIIGWMLGDYYYKNNDIYIILTHKPDNCKYILKQKKPPRAKK